MSLFCSSSFIRLSSGWTLVLGKVETDIDVDTSALLAVERLVFMSTTDFGDTSDATEDDEFGIDSAPVIVASSCIGCGITLNVDGAECSSDKDENDADRAIIAVALVSVEVCIAFAF